MDDGRIDLGILKQNLFSFEALFTLFLFVGLYKQAPILDRVPGNLTAILAVISAIVGGYVLITKAERPPRSGLVLTVLLGAFICYALLSNLWTPSSEYATSKSLELATVTFWSLGAPALIISKSRRRLRRFLTATVIFSVVIAAISIFQFVVVAGESQLRPFDATYLLVGRVIGIAFLITVAYTLYEASSKMQRRVGIALSGLFGFILLVNGARGPLLASFGAGLWLGIGYFDLSKSPRELAQTDLAKKIGAVVLIGAIVFVVLLYLDELPNTIQRIVATLSGKSTGSVEGRVDYYLASIPMWLSAPAFGHGIGSWPILYGMGDVKYYPHNIVLEILVEFGLFGLLLFGSLFGCAAYLLLAPKRPLHRDPYRILFVALLLFMGFNAFVTSDIPDNRYLFTMLGLTAYCYRATSVRTLKNRNDSHY
ncbi:O-antigen ligase family protein (plasmid) [Haladaptatus sp. SPP-AMP-3]|uniref:O-antigen ligase family protein n=1 Tax=Haladaptatus sp. SPP-AMP-3 TaxID=3121295 RepID=UPI003C2B65C3